MIDHNFKNSCIQRINYLINKFKLDLRLSTYTETTSMCKFDLIIGDSKIQQILSLENEFQSMLGKKTMLDFNNGFLSVILPKQSQDKLPLFDILNSKFYKQCPGTLKIALGENIEGSYVVGDLEKWVHLLIGGEPGGGKSIFLHSIINSLIHNCDEDIVKLVLIDTKEVELGLYEGIPHLLRPVATNIRSATETIQWLVKEMDKRKTIIRAAKCRDIKSYNRKNQNKLPYIALVIDEYANLVLRNKDIEEEIIDIAQLARFCGIHIVIATQKPSGDIISTKLKANIPTRIAFSVASHYDSKVILDVTGAEKLNKRGDMYLKDEDGIERIQGCYISEEEIEEIVMNLQTIKQDFVKDNVTVDLYDFEVKADYKEPLLLEYFEPDEEYKDFYKAAIAIIKEQKCNHWRIRQILRVGDNKGYIILDRLQKEGVIGSEKVGYDYKILMSLNEFKNKFKRV
jgi:DNA segregation ATPase FtsK/SpoIIIE, S-DNA-T family